MSHSLLHQEKRRVRAKLKAKENRIIRNSPHLVRETRVPLIRSYSSPRSPSFLGSIWMRMQSILRLINVNVKKLPIQEAIHGRGWLSRQQRKEAHKDQHSRVEDKEVNHGKSTIGDNIRRRGD